MSSKPSENTAHRRQGGANRRGGGRGRGRGGRGNRGGARGGRREGPVDQDKLDEQMVNYWAKSEDPKLKERAEKEKKERAELLNKKKQEKLDEEMKTYWKKQKTEESTAGESKSAAGADTTTEKDA